MRYLLDRYQVPREYYLFSFSGLVSEVAVPPHDR
jgi:hypothetical protein